MRPTSAILLIVVFIAQAGVAHADPDSAQTPFSEIAPGRFVEVSLPYEVEYNKPTNGFRDAMIRDAEVGLDTVRIYTALGSDSVVVRVEDAGNIVYEEVVDRQPGLCPLGCEAGGAVSALLVEDCYGNLTVYIAGDPVYQKTLDPSVAVTVFKDNDAKLVSEGKSGDCGGEAVGLDLSGGDMPVLAAAVGVVLVLAGVALAVRGWLQ